jgi:hypothetical protein
MQSCLLPDRPGVPSILGRSLCACQRRNRNRALRTEITAKRLRAAWHLSALNHSSWYARPNVQINFATGDFRMGNRRSASNRTHGHG